MYAEKLTKFGIWFDGPMSPELFRLQYIEPAGFDIVVIGTGESRAVAAYRAVSHLEGKGVGPVLEQVFDELEFVLNPMSSTIEAEPPKTNMYCIIGIGVDWADKDD